MTELFLIYIIVALVMYILKLGHREINITYASQALVWPLYAINALIDAFKSVNKDWSK